MRRGLAWSAFMVALWCLALLTASALAIERLLVPSLALGTDAADIRRIALVAMVLLASLLFLVLFLIGQIRQRRLQGAHEKQLQEQLQLLRKQTSASEAFANVGSWEWDLDRGRAIWSDGMYRIYGVDRDNFQPTLESFLRRLPSEDREAVRGAIRQARDGGSFELEHRLLRPDGEVRIVLERGGGLPRLAGEPLRAIGTTQDITDRRNLEGRLGMRREIYMSLLEAQSDLGQGAIMTEGDRILYLNPALQELLALQSHEQLSLPDLLESIDPAGTSPLRREFEARRERVLPPTQGEARLTLPDGTAVDMEFVFDSIGFGDQVRIVALVRDVTERKRADAELRRSRERLRLFSLELSRAREQEGSRIAREIHDELGQRLTGLKMDLSWVAAGLRRDPAGRDLSAIGAKVEEMSALADDTIEEIRRIATELRPGVLDDLGLVAALEWQCQEFERRSGIVCNVRSPSEVTVSDDVSTALFRILQEALTNVSRHAQATRVDVRLTQEDHALTLEIEDNGRGTTEPSNEIDSLGLRGMAERARLIGGATFVGPVPEGGTIVLVRVPAEPSSATPPLAEPLSQEEP